MMRKPYQQIEPKDFPLTSGSVFASIDDPTVLTPAAIEGGARCLLRIMYGLPDPMQIVCVGPMPNGEYHTYGIYQELEKVTKCL